MILLRPPLDPPTPNDAVPLHPKHCVPPHVEVSSTPLLQAMASAWVKDALRGPITLPSLIRTVAALSPVSPVMLRRYPMRVTRHFKADEGRRLTMQLRHVALNC